MACCLPKLLFWMHRCMPASSDKLLWPKVIWIVSAFTIPSCMRINRSLYGVGPMVNHSNKEVSQRLSSRKERNCSVATSVGDRGEVASWDWVGSSINTLYNDRQDLSGDANIPENNIQSFFVVLFYFIFWQQYQRIRFNLLKIICLYPKMFPRE